MKHNLPNTNEKQVDFPCLEQYKLCNDTKLLRFSLRFANSLDVASEVIRLLFNTARMQIKI